MGFKTASDDDSHDKVVSELTSITEVCLDLLEGLQGEDNIE
jgi:hypothetical protein